MKEYRINNVEVVLKEKCYVDDLLDAVEDNRVFIPALNVNNFNNQIISNQWGNINSTNNSQRNQFHSTTKKRKK